MRHATLPLAALLLAGCFHAKVSTNEAPPSDGTSARVVMRNAQGQNLGDLALVQTHNGVLITGFLNGVPAGTHAFHVHTVGKCTPDFNAAGGHFNPAAHQHGFRNPQGMHAGDLPNINVAADGTVRVEVFASSFNLGTGKNGLLDADGSSIMIHALADDYTTDPAGAAGARIACGEVTK